MRLLALVLLALPRDGVVVSAVAPVRVHGSPVEVDVCRVLDGGRVLAGGRGGLVFHGGDTTRQLTAIDGLPGTAVHSLLVGKHSSDGTDSVWVGLESGLARISWGPSGVAIAERIDGPDVRALVEAFGQLWVGTWGRGLGRLGPGGLEFPFDRSPKRVAALALFEGSLHAATVGDGVWRVRGKAIEPVTGAPESPFLWTLRPWRDGLLVGGTTGLWRLGTEGGPLLAMDVRAVIDRPSGPLVGTFGDGLRILDDHGTSSDGGLAGAFVTDLDSRGGTTCAATTEGLVVSRWANEADSASPRWERVTWPGLPSVDISALASGAGPLALGTFDGGASILVEGGWRPVAAPPSAARVNAVLVEGPRTRPIVWLGTARGLFRVEERSVWHAGVEEGLPSAEVHALLRLRTGALLVGTARGLSRIRRTGVAEANGDRGGPGSAAVWALAEGADGTLFVGTTRGLYHRFSTGPWRRASLASGELTDDWVTAILATPSIVWVGGYAGGVSRLSVRSGRILRSEALGGGNVNPGGLALVGDNLCAATMQGLLCRCSAASERWEVVADAAPGRDVTGVVRWGGRVFVSSRRGLAEWPDGGLSLPACSPKAP